jgi:gliding motility-associated-like protein
MVSFTVSPPGGTLTINGNDAMPSFNPAQLGSGNHEIFYTRGTGECASSQRLFFSVLPPISGTVEAKPDSVCIGQNSVIDIQTSGGLGTLTPIWDSGLGFGKSHIVNPQSTTSYAVNVSDGCSEDLNDTVEVYVYPEFTIEINTGPPVCYEETTFAEIIPPVTGQYEVVWMTNPKDTGTYISGPPGIYPMTIRELLSNCEQSYDIELPGASPLRANFSIIPNQDCINIIENEIEIIDLANGYSQAWMDFGDGMDSFSLDGNIITHAYTDTGSFQITQYVENDLGCRDSLSKRICVENKVRIFIPNVFTPNNDGKNDELEIAGFGITDVQWSVWDRYGARVFEGQSLMDTWDGTYNGKFVRPGVFVCKIEYRDAATGERGAEWQSVTVMR